jgi:competence protein ComFC
MSISSLSSQILEGFLQLVYPPVCVVCQNIIQETNELKIVCTSCLQKIQVVPSDFTREQILERLNPCYLDHLEAVLQFDEIVQTIIHQIKYQKADRLARTFAAYARQTGNKYFLQQEDLVIPVPLFKAREKERGFNQSHCIAEGFYRESGQKICPQFLRRSRATLTQTELNREERMKNVSQAFVVENSEDIKGKSIILVDDVVTTGATLNECALALKKAGALRVSGLTLATPTIPEHLINQ